MLKILKLIVGTLKNSGLGTVASIRLLLQALLSANQVWSAIPAAKRPPEQLKPFAFIIALAQLLEKTVGRSQAVETMHKVIFLVADSYNETTYRQKKLNRFRDPLERLKALYSSGEDLTDLNEETIFTQPTAQSTAAGLDDDFVFAKQVKRCVFYDFFVTFDWPELATAVCDADAPFFERHFALAYSRGDSHHNTIAYGREHCLYQWKR